MKPKTKIQKAVNHLANYLPKLTQTQIDYACSKFFDKRCFATKKTAFCLECGSDIDVKKIVRKRVVCESCGNKLKVTETRKIKHSSESYFFTVASLIKHDVYDFQVVRNFEFIKHYRKGRKASLYIDEFAQNWYEIKGKKVINARFINGYNGSCYGELGIREEGYYKDYETAPDIFCPTSEFREEYIKNGISHKMTGISLKRAIHEVQYPQMETLLKMGYYGVFSNWKAYQVSQYWNTLKICFRNKYKITKPSLYKDMLDALSYLNKDLRNAHYVCPKNLHKAHDYYIQKMNEVKNGKTLAQNMKKANEANPKFIKEKEKFFDLEISHGPIKIVPLKSVPEFLAEGEFLKHCVFRSNYYNRKDSLILSARIKNKPVETIEISLKDFTVVQCHGKNNLDSEYHKEILSLVKNNIHKVKQLSLN